MECAMSDDFTSKDETLGRAVSQIAHEIEQRLKEETGGEQVGLFLVAVRPGSDFCAFAVTSPDMAEPVRWVLDRMAEMEMPTHRH
jgi:hypothetical protein